MKRFSGEKRKRNKNILMKPTVNKLTILFILLPVFSFTDSFSQDESDVIRNTWMQYSDAPNSLYHHLADQAVSILEKRKEEVKSISTAEQWIARQDYIRKTLFDITGPFPEKTPLNARITKTIVKEQYRVEHIIFESQPGFYVTSSLYIPKNLPKKTKAPAVIYCSGHSEEGYRSSVYQYVIINLVLKGFIVFAFDPVGQGERLEYYDPQTGKSSAGGPTKEHSYPGNQAFIAGSSQARYMIWDGIRAVDYLLTRREVDPARIGITGRSGGGTQSSYIAAFDDRIYACAPECYITTFERLLQTMGNQDAEQNFPQFISKGLDLPDLLTVRAPKPTLMITTTRDIFNIQGAREAEAEVSRAYLAYGKADNFGRAEDDTSHATTKRNREAMYAFFQKHLNNPGDPADRKVELLSKEEMMVTEAGQVSVSLKGETVFSLNKKDFEANILKGKSFSDRNDSNQGILTGEAKRLSGYIEPADNVYPVFSGRTRKTGYSLEKYFIKGEGDYVIPYLLFVPSKPNGKAMIYLHPAGKAAEAKEGGELEMLALQGFTVLAPDLIGIGETGNGQFKGDAYIDGESHNLWYCSIVIGRSILGIRAADVIRLVNILKTDKNVSEIWGIARMEMAPVMLHSASFSSSISRLILIEPLASYKSLVANRFYKASFISSAVPAALAVYDLPDLAGKLAPRKLTIVNPVSSMGKADNSEGIKDDMEIIRTLYSKSGAGDNLKIIYTVNGDKADIKELIK